jgi:hypothetical protein
MFRIMALALIVVSCLQVPHAPAALLDPQEGTFKLAQYCIPQDYDADRLFCHA